MDGLIWKKPKCKVTRKIPFIPKETELDALIAVCGKKTATFLRLQKETEIDQLIAGSGKKMSTLTITKRNCHSDWRSMQNQMGRFR
jgi:hypothetical protein